MADERLLAAAELLQKHYGRIDLGVYRTGWSGLVRYLLERMLAPKKFQKAWLELESSWLIDVEDVAAAQRSDLFELLNPQGVAASNVALIHRLASWWLQQLDAGQVPLEPGSVSLESQWESLATHDPSWMTRIFCVVGGWQRFPIKPGNWRIACRHAWTSWYDDPAEAGAFYESACFDSPFELGELAEWLIRVGEDYCGPKPKCVGCPLQPLLGPGGPCEADE